MNEYPNVNNEDRLRDALRSAYDTAELSEDLQQRVAAMAGRHVMVPGRASRVLRLRAALAGGMLTLVLLGAMAFHYLFYRPGESAILMIPADALSVVTVDLTPSPTQALVFKRIGDALKAANVDQVIRDVVQDEAHAGSIATEVRAHLAASLAIAVMDPTGRRGYEGAQPVVFLAIKNRDGVEQALAKHGTRVYRYGLTLYRFSDGEPAERMLAMYTGDYLILSADASLLKRVQLAARGEIPAVAHLPEYQMARAELPEDANVMVFLSPTALAAADRTGQNAGFQPFRKTSWLAFSATIRDEGIAFDYRWPIAATADESRHIARIPGLQQADFKRLPAGAYGVFALSQPAAYWSGIQEMATSKPDGRHDWNPIREMERETGLSVTGDILPAFQGHAWIAAYPDPADTQDGVAGLMLIDDANGANATPLAEKLRAYIERKTTGKGEHGIHFIEEKIARVRTWRLDPGSRRQIDRTDVPFLGGHVRVKQDEGDDLSGITFAEIGNAVVIATSRPMLVKAIDCYRGIGPTLADDPEFAAMRARSVAEPQGVLMVRLSAIMQRLRPSLQKWGKDANISADDLVNLFGLSNGLVVSGRYDGQIERGSSFLPLDYDRSISLLREVRASMKEGPSRGRARSGNADDD